MNYSSRFLEDEEEITDFSKLKKIKEPLDGKDQLMLEAKKTIDKLLRDKFLLIDTLDTIKKLSSIPNGVYTYINKVLSEV